MGDTSSNGWVFHCYVSFLGCSWKELQRSDFFRQQGGWEWVVVLELISMALCVGWPLCQERGRRISEIYSMNTSTTQKIWNMDWLRQGCHAFEVVSLRHHGIFARESPCSMPRPGCCPFQPMPKPFLLWCFGKGIWHSLSELWSPYLGGGFIFFVSNFYPWGNDDPIWRIFFRWVAQPPTSYLWYQNSNWKPCQKSIKNPSRVYWQNLVFLSFLTATPFQASRQLVFASKYGKCWY